jgi:hypothetical protein
MLLVPRRPLLWMPAAALFTLAGCASAPLSFVDAAPTPKTDSNHYPVRVVSVDNSLQFGAFGKPVQLAPGPHRLVLEAAPAASARGTVQKTVYLTIEPCRRHLLAAHRASPLQADWSLVEMPTEPVGNCNVQDELRKAQVG